MVVAGSGGTKPRIEPVMDTAPKRGCIANSSKAGGAVRPPFSQWPETMSFQSDLSSGVALYALKDLKDAGRLKIRSIQKAWLLGVEGTKGKQEFGRSGATAVSAFSRTATHVFRIVMLEACGVNPDHWPSGGETSYRNEDKLKYEQVMGPKFVLADSYEQGREFWSEFDKIYPHFLLEKTMEEGGSLNKMMIVFTNYMQEHTTTLSPAVPDLHALLTYWCQDAQPVVVGKFAPLVVEITMNVCAEHFSGKHVKCCVSCTVVHRLIDIDGAEGKCLDVLALSVRGTRCPLLRHFDRMLDLDTSMATDLILKDNFNEIYDSLPNDPTEIDDTSNCGAAGSSLATGNENKHEDITQNNKSKSSQIAKKEDRRHQLVEIKTEKTVTTTKTKTVTRDGKVVEHDEETNVVKLKTDPSDENIETNTHKVTKSQSKTRNQQEPANPKQVKVKSEPIANKPEGRYSTDDPSALD